MMRVADTSFLYAAFDEDDERHPDALDEISKPEPLAIPLAVWAEFLDLVTYRHGHRAAVHAHQDLLKLGTVQTIQAGRPEQAFALWSRHPSSR